MGHLYTDIIVVKGTKGEEELKDVLIDTGTTYKGAKTVIGVETLESIVLKLDQTTGNLEFTRPKGMAYFY